MKINFFTLIVVFFHSFLAAAQCTTLYITEHQSGSPICNLQEGDYIEICGDEVIGCPRNLYIYNKGSQSGSIVYNLTLDQGWTTHYGRLLVNPNTMLLGFEIQGQTAVYGYSTKPMSDERKKQILQKEEEERKEQLKKEEEKKEKELQSQKKYENIINKAKKAIKDNPSLFTQRIYVHPEGYTSNSLNDSIYYFEVFEIGELSWNYANNTCNDLGYGWRLPTIQELEVIYYSCAALNTKWYNSKNILKETIWSSKEDMTCKSFNGFIKQNEGKINKYTDRPTESKTFVIRDEKYIRINNIEVMSKDFGTMTYWEFYNMRNFQTQNNNPWRLPTIEELEMIYKNKSQLNDLQNKPYLSSSVDEQNTYTFDFRKGKSKTYKSSSYYAYYKGFNIRLVRTIK